MRRVFVAAGCALVALFSLALYRGAVDNEFIWDDPIIFERQLPYFDSLSNVFHPPKSIPQFGVHYYRPLTVMSFQLDEWISGKFWPRNERAEARRLVYHTSVVVEHALMSALVLLAGLALARRAGLRGSPAAVAGGAAALLFAAHPIHVEVVAWMAGRADALCGIFFLGAVLAFIEAREATGMRRILLVGATAVFSLAAMLAKETGVAVLLAIALVEFLLPAAPAPETPAADRAERRRREREARKAGRPQLILTPPRWPVWIALAAVTGIYFALRRAALGTFGSPAPGSGIPFERAAFGSLGWYIRKAFWPPPQSAFVPEVPGGATALLGAAAFLLFAAAVSIVWLLRLSRSEPPVWAPEVVATGIFFAGIAPPLAIALRRISETPLAERYLYLPSAGLCLAAGLLLGRLSQRLERAGNLPALALPAAVVAALLLPSARQTVRRAEVWQNNLAFWTDAVRKAPDEGLPHLHLGIEYNDRGEKEKAIEEYRKAFERYDDAEGRSKALNNWGSALLGLGRYQEAIEKFRLALREVARYPTPHYNWGIAAEGLARAARDPAERRRLLAEARLHYQKALEINPRYTKAHVQYGALLAQLGDFAGSRRHLKRAIQLAPASRSAERARRMLERLDKIEAERRSAGPRRPPSAKPLNR
ncbi:MAG: hypothetical protein D6718_10510 [Acidobacteria bacterium]|nr:MAG: hypothetical protein D6718_10510 [Acidobacteriota bacterium]